MFYFLFVIFVFGAMVMGGMVTKSKQNDAWAAAGLALGLTSTGTRGYMGQTRIGGAMGDVRVDAYTENRGSGDNNSVWTVYEITFAMAGPNVTLKRASTMSRLRRAIGFDDILIGDPRFDEEVDVIANDAAQARDFLTPGRRAAVLSLFEMFPLAEVGSSRIRVSSRGVERNADRIVSNVRKLADMARLIGESALVDRALQLEADGDLGGAADALAAAQESDPNLYIKLLEAEARVAMGERRRAAEMLTELEKQLPSDPEVAGWHRVAGQVLIPGSVIDDVILGAPEPSIAQRVEVNSPSEQPVAPQPATPVSAPPPALLASDLRADPVVADLFANNRPSYEVEEQFSNAYRGATVTWSGSVQKINEFRSDRDFGNTPGLKATINIGSLGDGRLVSDQVDAIVEFGPDAALERDTEITFSGTLHRVDRFMRNIYVTDAIIV